MFNTSVTNEIITLQTSQGCDSIITLNLVVLNSDTTVTNRSICEGGFVDIGGNIFTTAGTHYITFTNGQCTGTVQLNLTVNQPSESTIDATVCEGDLYTIGGQVFNTTGKYFITVPNSVGCDSIITLNLTVNPSGRTTIDTLICAGESVTVGGRTFSVSGTYTITVPGSLSCDSIITLNLGVLVDGDTTALDQTICAGESVTIGGQTFTTAGTFYVPVALGGCSSTIELTLAVNQPSTSTVNAELCEGEAIVVGGQTFTIEGNYTITLQNSAGCDSIITLNLDISEGGIKTQTDTTICLGDTIQFAGQTFTTTGTYQVIYPANVCRDTLLLNLTVNNPTTATIDTSLSTCEDTIIIAGQIFTDTGVFTIVIPNSIGCDSIITVNIPTIRICDNPPIKIIIIDTIYIRTDTIHCDLAIDSTRENVVIAECVTGATVGTSNHGTWEIDVNGCFIFNGGPIKGTDTLFICACDSVTGICDETEIRITLIGYPPVAVNDTVRTGPNSPITIPVLNNDTTYDEDPLALCNPGAIVTQPTRGTVIVNGDGTITYTPVTGYIGIDSFQYSICDPPVTGEGSDTAWVFITIAGCEIPNAFSPNGDGINDYFVISCAAGPVEFSVYNRWGIEVYRNDKYLNDWDGQYKGSPLPDGTYYYVLKFTTFGGEEVNKAGFVTLHR